MKSFSSITFSFLSVKRARKPKTSIALSSVSNTWLTWLDWARLLHVTSCIKLFKLYANNHLSVCLLALATLLERRELIQQTRILTDLSSQCNQNISNLSQAAPLLISASQPRNVTSGGLHITSSTFLQVKNQSKQFVFIYFLLIF